MFSCSYYTYLISSYDKNKHETPFNFIFYLLPQKESELMKYINDITEFILYEYNNRFDNIINDYYELYNNHHKYNKYKDNNEYNKDVDYYEDYKTFIDKCFNTEEASTKNNIKTNITNFKNKLLSLGYNDSVSNNIIMKSLILVIAQKFNNFNIMI